jgi:flagellin-like protein
MTRMHANRRAVSPIIATVLMILIVMAGMTILFAFVGSYTQGFQSGSGSAVLESLTFEDVWFTDSNHQMSIWIYNTGKADITLNLVYVDGASVPMYYQNLTLIHSNSLVKVGAHFHMIVFLEQQESNYTIRISTQRGSGFEGVFSP